MVETDFLWDMMRYALFAMIVIMIFGEINNGN